MVVPFGFGVSDVIALSNLAANCVSAIKEARGASSESRHLISSLRSLQGALGSLASTINTGHHGASSSACRSQEGLDNSLVNGIGLEIKQCTRVLQEFCRAHDFDIARGSWLHKAQKGLQWKYAKPQKLAQLQEALAPRVKALEFYVSTSMM